MELKNTYAHICGEVVENFTYSHELFGEKFYQAIVMVKRTSGNADYLPVMVSNRLVDVNEDWLGECIDFKGQLRTHKINENEKTRHHICLFAQEAEIGYPENITNKVYLDGYLCKDPIYRTTPKGREITELVIAVNRPFGKSDYIHCICWGRNARHTKNFKSGAHCVAEGRFQSHEYLKIYEDGTSETKTTYEVSISTITLEKTKGENNNETA